MKYNIIPLLIFLFFGTSLGAHNQVTDSDSQLLGSDPGNGWSQSPDKKSFTKVVLKGGSKGEDAPATSPNDFPINAITDYDVRILEYTPASDPDFGWDQFSEKKSKAIMGKYGLELESKEDGSATISCMELPIDVKSEDFLVAMKTIPQSFDDAKPFGIVYDYENEDNYRALLILKKGFQLVKCVNGKISVVKKGLYKGKEKEVILSITRNKNKLYFGVNGINLCEQSNIELTYPNFGLIIVNKGKIMGRSVAYKKMQPKEHEED